MTTSSPKLHSDVISVIASFLSFQELFVMEIICKEWKLGLFHYCASVKTFQLTKKMVYLVTIPKPRPDLAKMAQYKPFEFNNQVIDVDKKKQNQGSTIRMMVSKWFGEMFINIERVHFSDVSLSRGLVYNLFKNNCSKVKQLTFVGCYLEKNSIQEITNRMKNLECVIFYKHYPFENFDVEQMNEFLKCNSMKFMYYPKAEMVNLSKLTDLDKKSQYYFELDDDCNVNESKDADNHQVFILNIEKTKQFQKAKENSEENLKMFGIASNEFKDFYFKAMELPTNQCIAQLCKLIDNGMHLFDVYVYSDFVSVIIKNHWRNLDKFRFLTTLSTYQTSLPYVSLEFLKKLTTFEEQLEFVKHIYCELGPRSKLEFFQGCETMKILQKIILSNDGGTLDINMNEFNDLEYFTKIKKTLSNYLNQRNKSKSNKK